MHISPQHTGLSSVQHSSVTGGEGPGGAGVSQQSLVAGQLDADRGLLRGDAAFAAADWLLESATFINGQELAITAAALKGFAGGSVPSGVVCALHATTELSTGAAVIVRACKLAPLLPEFTSTALKKTVLSYTY